jgi:hypothetical protein
MIYEEHNGLFVSRRTNSTTSVAHATQLFLRECFETLEGYLALPYGGPDWHAEVSAPMMGYFQPTRHCGRACGELLSAGADGFLVA